MKSDRSSSIHCSNFIIVPLMDCKASLYTLLLLFFCNLAFSQYATPDFGGNYFENSIIGTTRASSDHKMLAAAVKAAELADLLDNDGPFTIFAPSDTAFKNWSVKKLKALMRPENKKLLQALLTYHMVAGKLTASKILRAMCHGSGTATFTTVEGSELVASMDGIDIVLTDCSGNSARITRADADLCNGVIHEIDHVILPVQR